MKVLLDSKDLIDLAEHATPLSLPDFRHRLQGKGAEAVLSYTNVREVAAPMATTGEILRIRAVLNQIEALPVCYIREAFIIVDELKSARRSFDSGRDYEPIDPFVPRWDYTFQYHESAAKDYVGYSLFNIVNDVSKSNPQVLLHDRKFAEGLRNLFSNERQMPRNIKKSPSANFPSSVARHLQFYRLRTPVGGVDAFGKWIYADPTRCPGFRFCYEMYHAVQANLSDIPKDGDIPDMTHFYAIPYVHYATVDRRMHGYGVQVARGLSRVDPRIKYEQRLFRSADHLLTVL
jgi:hypothetical protein